MSTKQINLSFTPEEYAGIVRQISDKSSGSLAAHEVDVILAQSQGLETFLTEDSSDGGHTTTDVRSRVMAVMDRVFLGGGRASGNEGFSREDQPIAREYLLVMLSPEYKHASRVPQEELANRALCAYTDYDVGVDCVFKKRDSEVARALIQNIEALPSVKNWRNIGRSFMALLGFENYMEFFSEDWHTADSQRMKLPDVIESETRYFNQDVLSPALEKAREIY